MTYVVGVPDDGEDTPDCEQCYLKAVIVIEGEANTATINLCKTCAKELITQIKEEIKETEDESQ